MCFLNDWVLEKEKKNHTRNPGWRRDELLAKKVDSTPKRHGPSYFSDFKLISTAQVPRGTERCSLASCYFD